MATHDYVIDNSTGANVRADINSVLQAILTNNSSSSAPSTTAAYMFWADTTSGTLKIRNSSDNAWVELLQLDGTLTLEDGSASTPGLAFRDDLNTGIFSSAADTFNVATGGVERMELGATTIFNEDGADVDFRIEGDTEANLFYVDAGNDRVAIGTNSPTDLVHVKDTSIDVNLLLEATGSGKDARLKLLAHSSGVSQIQFGDGDDGNIGLMTYDHSDNSLAFRTNDAERMRIDSSGRLLIAHTAVTPVDNDANNPIFQVEGTGADDSRISIRHNSTSASNAASIYLSRSKGTSTGSKTSIASGDALGSLIFMGADGTHDTRAAIIQASCDGTPGDNDMPGRLEFYTTPDGGLNSVERMRIDSSGNVGIGTTSPSAPLTVSGTIFQTNTSTSITNSILHLRNTVSSGQFRVRFDTNNNIVGSISVGTSSTAYNTSSDYRLKENITAISDGITRLKTLKPSRFNWITEPNTTVDGFLAHEVTAVPEAIEGTKDAVITQEMFDAGETEGEVGDPIYQQIDQSKLVPLLTAALQEAIAKIEVLETKVAALEAA